MTASIACVSHRSFPSSKKVSNTTFSFFFFYFEPVDPPRPNFKEHLSRRRLCPRDLCSAACQPGPAAPRQPRPSPTHFHRLWTRLGARGHPAPRPPLRLHACPSPAGGARQPGERGGRSPEKEALGSNRLSPPQGTAAAGQPRPAGGGEHRQPRR